MKHYQIIKQIISLLTCIILMSAVALQHDHRLWGHPLDNKETAHLQVADTGYTTNSRVTDEGEWIISTREMGKDIIGYAGNIPLNIYLKDNKITKIEVLNNAETPGFMNRVITSGLLERWYGLTPQEALKMQPDAVTGATYTSTAIIKSVNRAMEYACQTAAPVKKSAFKPDFKFFIALAVVLSGMLIPLFTKSKIFRIIQLIFNAGILGFWCGHFISLSLITNYLSNGISFAIAVIPLLLLFAAFIMPLFGKKNHYCLWLCPMGSLQELAGKVIPYKLPLSSKLVQWLTYFRRGLWVIIMVIMLCGFAFEIMDYEIFSAFLFRQASVPVLIMAGTFILLSFVVSRPYCRFICPTGTLVKLSQRSNYKFR